MALRAGLRGGWAPHPRAVEWMVPTTPVTTWPPPHSAANVKKWEIELQTLRESNARLDLSACRSRQPAWSSGSASSPCAETRTTGPEQGGLS